MIVSIRKRNNEIEFRYVRRDGPLSGWVSASALTPQGEQE